jgi:DNA-3-methyladenine glycosylase
MKLGKPFYRHTDVCHIARALLGKYLFTRIGDLTGGIIVETEAYSWREKGCHAYGNKKTPRNSIMFQSGGVAYVYKCYGIHHLFNVVTGNAENAEAVLIRAIEPFEGESQMLLRAGRSSGKITAGPGKLTRALGIDQSFNGADLCGDSVWIEDRDMQIKSEIIIASPRIGIDYAGVDAKLPWRFSIAQNDFVSRKPA